VDGASSGFGFSTMPVMRLVRSAHGVLDTIP
jgi:hypothetical protein